MHALLFLFYLSHITLTTAEPPLTLVRDGRPNLTILMPANAGKYQKLAVNDFVSTIRQASGATVPVRDEGQFRAIPNGQTMLVFGPSALTDSLLGRRETTKPEEFKLITKGNVLVVLAKDLTKKMEQRNTLTTTFALAYLMENYMGVKWYWPGKLGTHVPVQKTITIPALNVAQQPKLLRRRFNLHTADEDLMLWAAHHRALGERIDYNFMHSFRKIGQNGDWWADFYETKPYLLAQSPNGKPEKLGRDEFFKICTTHPETTDEIVRRWTKAGSPDTWDLTDNDGKGWCTCDRCRAIDKEFGGVEYSKDDIWRGRDFVNLTERYVWFWNKVVKRMHETNPNTRILVHLYSQHRVPPRNQKLEPGILGEMVHGYDFSVWHDWTKAGVTGIGLRPNWWYMGGSGPHLPLHTVGDYIKQAHQNRMTHLFMDALNEFWATQGPYYYMVGRLADHPDLNIDAIIDDYCSAFGKGAKDVRAYVDFWENYMKKVAYNIPAGGSLSVDSTGIYERVCRQYFGGALHPLQNHWKTMPYIYTPDVLKQGRGILAKAIQRAKGDSLATQRIVFLEDGLRHVELSSAFLKAEKADKEKTLTALADFDKAMRAKHGYWGSKEIKLMKQWGLIGKEFNVDDM
jgi:hypothetical protein